MHAKRVKGSRAKGSAASTKKPTKKPTARGGKLKRQWSADYVEHVTRTSAYMLGLQANGVPLSDDDMEDNTLPPKKYEHTKLRRKKQKKPRSTINTFTHPSNLVLPKSVLREGEGQRLGDGFVIDTVGSGLDAEDWIYIPEPGDSDVDSAAKNAKSRGSNPPTFVLSTELETQSDDDSDDDDDDQGFDSNHTPTTQRSHRTKQTQKSSNWESDSPPSRRKRRKSAPNNSIPHVQQMLRKSQHQTIGASNVGHALLSKMGWTGGGLGAKENGRTEPICLTLRAKRAGLGSKG